jgi:hypothetical protein
VGQTLRSLGETIFSRGLTQNKHYSLFELYALLYFDCYSDAFYISRAECRRFTLKMYGKPLSKHCMYYIATNIRTHLHHRVHRVATATFWRSFHHDHDGKISPGCGGGGGAHPPPSLYLPSRTKLWCTLQLRGQIHSLYFYYTPLCTLRFAQMQTCLYLIRYLFCYFCRIFTTFCQLLVENSTSKKAICSCSISAAQKAC